VADFERAKNPLTAKFPGFEFGDVREDDAKSRKELPEQKLNARGETDIDIDLARLPGSSRRSPCAQRSVCWSPAEDLLSETLNVSCGLRRY
jgi:hypothetical protein